MSRRIYLGSDHAGFELKEKIKHWLTKKRIIYSDLGNIIFNPDDDYPDFAASVAKRVVKEKTQGILFCGSAEGMCIAANKIKGVRAVNPSGLIQARRAREHEDATILCLAGGRSRKPQPSVSFLIATKMITIFLNTRFSGEERHIRRLAKIKKLER